LTVTIYSRKSLNVSCQTPSKRRTDDGRTKRCVSSSVRPFVCLFVLCVRQGRPAIVSGGTSHDASQKFKGDKSGINQ